jgi:hypothetical protein
MCKPKHSVLKVSKFHAGRVPCILDEYKWLISHSENFTLVGRISYTSLIGKVCAGSVLDVMANTNVIL